MKNTMYVRSSPKGDFTHVAVSVYHCSHRKRLCTTFYPAYESHGSFGIAITSGKHSYGDEMKRDNAKRVAAAFEDAKRQIEAKAGPVYDALQKAASEFGQPIA